MNRTRLIEIEVRVHGKETPNIFRARAQSCHVSGDMDGEQRWLDDAIEAERILAAEQLEHHRRQAVDPEASPLFGGVSGVRMENDSFDLGDGVCLRSTFAHVMAPYLLAFSPAQDGQPHPAPWKAASGGIGFDIHVELAMPLETRPTGFDRLNTIWWILALLRLHRATGVRIPVISNMSFADAAHSSIDPIFWTIEMAPRQMHFDTHDGLSIIDIQLLDWIKANYQAGALLMNDAGFNLAFRALDSAHIAADPSSAMLLVWSAIEALFRPGRNQITHRLSAAVATYLTADPASRDTRYQEIKKLYESRGLISHAAERPKFSEVAASFHLARKCFVTAMESQSLPDSASLLTRWRGRC